MFYAIAHHGTAGLGQSYGYAEVAELDDAPRGDQTMTIAGPFRTRAEAQKEADAMDKECERFHAEQGSR